VSSGLAAVVVAGALKHAAKCAARARGEGRQALEQNMTTTNKPAHLWPARRLGLEADPSAWEPPHLAAADSLRPAASVRAAPRTPAKSIDQSISRAGHMGAPVAGGRCAAGKSARLQPAPCPVLGHGAHSARSPLTVCCVLLTAQRAAAAQCLGHGAGCSRAQWPARRRQSAQPADCLRRPCSGQMFHYFQPEGDLRHTLVASFVLSAARQESDKQAGGQS